MKTFDLFNKISNYPIVVSIPHSGTFIPDEIRQTMISPLVLPNMDWFLPELYSFLISMGVTVIKNNISRYVIDPNRDITKNIFGEYGSSLVYQKTTWAKPMYSKPLAKPEIQDRIDKYYLPYHNALHDALIEKIEKYDKAYLLDMHSFATFSNDTNADIILSDNEHETSSKEYFSCIKKNLINNGFSISENKPFRGGYITKHYGTAFGNSVESIQMEIRYAKYIEERYFGEEELFSWNEKLFSETQNNLYKALSAALRFIDSRLKQHK